MYVYNYVHVYVCMCIRTYMYMHVYVYVYTYACMYICVYDMMGVVCTYVMISCCYCRSLYNTFASPWADSPCRLQDIGTYV